MPTGTLAPWLYQQFLNENGDPLENGQVETFEAGTTTPAETWSQADLIDANLNSNPIVLDGSGFGRIYLQPGNSYKFKIYDEDGALIRTVDNINAVGLAATPTSDNGIVQGRLTLEAGVAVPATDRTSAQTLYFTPYGGNAIALYDSVTMGWLLHSFSELSQDLTALLANTNYDVFAGASGDQVALSVVAWASATARATALDNHDGVLVKGDDSTKRYLGTIRITSVAGRGEDSLAHRFVWNYYNRVPRPMRVIEATNGWTYTTDTYRQFNGSTANQVAVVIGVVGVPVTAECAGFAANDLNAMSAAVSIGLDSATTPATGVLGMRGTSGAAAQIASPRASLRIFPGIGYHYLTALERSITVGGTTTWYGDDGGQTLQAGITGEIDG